jgi:hypothetical protein
MALEILTIKALRDRMAWHSLRTGQIVVHAQQNERLQKNRLRNILTAFRFNTFGIRRRR